MQKAIMIFESLIYIIIGAICGRAIFYKDWATQIMAIILFVIVVITFELVHDAYFEEKETQGV